MKRVLVLSGLFLVCATTASAQLIPIRTVPISQSHQFEILPSQTFGMAGVSIAIPDSLLDPFDNPAKGARLRAARFFGTPSVYSVTSKAGGGRTFPLGAMIKTGPWFGGLSVALQEVDFSQRNGFNDIIPFACPNCGGQPVDFFGPVERSHGNAYLFAMFGRDLPAAGLSVGGSFAYSELNAVDGVDLLYAGSARIKQYGDAVDIRFGVLKEWSNGRSLEALVLHNRFGMTHDVFYLDGFWDPDTQQFAQRPRLEQNLDRTRTWGLHTEYEIPLTTSGWRMGWLATVNRMSHPKIPNYEIQNIPRDPGNSNAFNVGVGVSRTYNHSTFGVDVIYEPIWSHTWADSEDPVETDAGEIIPPGGKTIENRFRFSNALFRMGFGQQIAFGETGTSAGIQFGLALRTIHYWLNQDDHVSLTSRNLEERWVEWTPSWGVSVRFPELEVGYRGRVTNGTGRPGVANNPGILVADAAGGSNILVAPSGPLTLDEVRVVTHQFSISLPLR